MAKEKQHVFSARTTEEGLKQLNGLKAKLGVSWGDLVIDAMCAHYNLDRLVMALPKAYKPEKPASKSEPAGEAAGTDDEPSEATRGEAPAKSKKAAKRGNRKNGGKEKHGKANTAAQQATGEATGN